jgi:hypothetical protein
MTGHATAREICEAEKTNKTHHPENPSHAAHIWAALVCTLSNSCTDDDRGVDSARGAIAVLLDAIEINEFLRLAEQSRSGASLGAPRLGAGPTTYRRRTG